MQTLSMYSQTQSQTHSVAMNKLAFNWLANNPRAWRGKQILCRRNGDTYTVRDVLQNGRVQLERKWVLYNSDVKTIRQDYEPVSP